MSFRSLRWLTVAIPLLFLALVDVLRHQMWPELLHPWPGFLVVLGIVAGATWLFSGLVFGQIETMERQIVEQNAMLRRAGETTRRQATQLEALHAAGLALSAELTLEIVLERIVDLARDLTGARYGALAVVDESGQIVRLLTQGLTDEERAGLGQPPTGRGLLGRIFVDTCPIRVDEIGRGPALHRVPTGPPPDAHLPRRADRAARAHVRQPVPD